jgi:hypothetical protein
MTKFQEVLLQCFHEGSFLDNSAEDFARHVEDRLNQARLKVVEVYEE